MTSQSQAMRVLTSRNTVDWYTPPHIIDRARATLGAIDLDPASCAAAQRWIGATVWHTLTIPPQLFEMLAHDPVELNRTIMAISRSQLNAQPPWRGRIWLNPPFDNTQLWVDRLEHEFATAPNDVSALLLVNAAPGYDWFERLWSRHTVCMLRERLRFINGDTGKANGEAKRGQAVVYFGHDDQRFAEYWRAVGRIIPAESTP